MVKDSVKFLVDTMLKNDAALYKSSEDVTNGRLRLGRNSSLASMQRQEESQGGNRSNLCLC